MRYRVFALRNGKELLRDPFSFLFGIGLPLLILVIISAMSKNVPNEAFQVQNFAPGIAIFSFSFISMFSGMLIGKDRGSSFLIRLFASPMTASDYIIGYSLPLLPIAVAQSAVCYITAFFFGLPVTVNVVFSIIILIPSAILFIGLGLLLGSVFSDKQVGGIMSVIIQVIAFTSGMWFDLSLLGNAVKTIGYILPFAHCVDSAREAIAGDFVSTLPNLAVIIIYTGVIFFFASTALKKKMKN